MVYKGKIVDLTGSVVMSIVNVTTDSFYDGGSYLEEKNFIDRVATEIKGGAAIIDIGGCSSRPGADRADVATEKARVEWALTILKREFSGLVLSIDTYRREVAESALNSWGEVIVNDIYGGEADDTMVDFVAANALPYISMHYQKERECDDITDSVMRFFYQKRELYERKGIKDVIFDVGFGFGKSLDENYQLIRDFESFSLLETPLLVGLSRKSMIYKLLETTPSESLSGTVALNSVLALKGANIFRVHDAKEAYYSLKVISKLKTL